MDRDCGDTDTAGQTLLVRLTGRDRPGVVAQVFGALGTCAVEVLDVEQVVIKGQTVLGVLFALGDTDPQTIRQPLHRIAAELDMDVEIVAGAGDVERGRGERLHVTVLGTPVLPSALAGVAGRIAACGANIDRIERLARYPVTCLEMQVSGAAPDWLHAELAAEAAIRRVDVAVQRSGLHRRAKRLVVMDVDSTLVQGEVIEVLAERAGCAEEVAKVTDAAMRGELDFEESLRSRVALLEGLDERALYDVRRHLRLAPGAQTLVRTLKRLDYRFAIVSGGFTQITDGLVELLGIDYSAANTLEVADGRLTGRVAGPVLDRAGKARALERFAREAGVEPSQTVAIGDGANDLDMLASAGLGIAFNARPAVREAADTAVNVPYLDAILYLLGISRGEIERADLEGSEDAADVKGGESRRRD